MHAEPEQLVLGVDLLAAADFDDLFGRHQHLVDVIGQAFLVGLLLDGLSDLLLKPGIDMYDVPALGHGVFQILRGRGGRRTI